MAADSWGVSWGGAPGVWGYSWGGFGSVPVGTQPVYGSPFITVAATIIDTVTRQSTVIDSITRRSEINEDS